MLKQNFEILAALLDLNIAVLYSHKKHGVRMLDHHTLSDYFMRFIDQEHQCGRPVQAEWAWIVPPMSGSTTPVFHVKFDGDRKLKPNYFDQPAPWKTITAT